MPFNQQPTDDHICHLILRQIIPRSYILFLKIFFFFHSAFTFDLSLLLLHFLFLFFRVYFYSRGHEQKFFTPHDAHLDFFLIFWLYLYINFFLFYIFSSDKSAKFYKDSFVVFCSTQRCIIFNEDIYFRNNKFQCDTIGWCEIPMLIKIQRY